MIHRAMRRVLKALRMDWLPWPLVPPFIFLGIIGLDLLFDGSVHVAGAIGGAFGGTLGAVWSRNRRRERQTVDTSIHPPVAKL